jgi:hypothetical protein
MDQASTLCYEDALCWRHSRKTVSVAVTSHKSHHWPALGGFAICLSGVRPFRESLKFTSCTNKSLLSTLQRLLFKDEGNRVNPEWKSTHGQINITINEISFYSFLRSCGYLFLHGARLAALRYDSKAQVGVRIFLSNWILANKMSGTFSHGWLLERRDRITRKWFSGGLSCMNISCNSLAQDSTWRRHWNCQSRCFGFCYQRLFLVISFAFSDI